MNKANIDDFYKVPNIKFDIFKLRSDLKKNIIKKEI